jgi:hypothetical protein
MMRSDSRQLGLFAGNRGCGKRERGSADAVETSQSVLVRIDGLETETPNTTRFTTQAGARAHAAHNKMVRETVWSRLLSVVGIRVRSRGVESVRVVRFSRGRLDDDNLVAALKYVRDGIAEALQIDDCWFSINGAVAGKLPFHCDQSPGKPGILIEVTFARGEEP